MAPFCFKVREKKSLLANRYEDVLLFKPNACSLIGHVRTK